MTSREVRRYGAGLKQFRRLCGSRDGNAAIEFGLLAPILTLALVGVIEWGLYAYQRVDMVAAARTGSQYFMSGGSSLSNAREIVRASWTEAPEDAAVAVDRVCQCAGAAASCNLDCPDGEVPDMYVSIDLSGTLSGIMLDVAGRTTDSVRIR